MAIDGSFCLESELERFLARCPKLGCLPRFVLLSKKANRLTEEEVVNSVADLFLHPDYTIPLVGCYRPIVRKIVDKAVALLSMVPNLRSDSDDTESEQDKILREAENFDNADAAFRFTKRMGLKLHELACLAFCRALDLAPFLLGSVLSYFKFAPPPFERIIKRGSVFELSTKDGTHIVDVARVSYRLLLREPEVFSKLWDWSCFLDLVQKSANFDQSNSDFLNNILDLRWCGIQILSVILKMSDKATANFGVEAEEALTCLLRWDEFCQDVSLEKAAWYLESSEQKKIGSNRMFDLNHESCLQSLGLDSLAVSSTLFHESEPSAKCRRPASRGVIAGDPFVLTSTLKKSFEMVLLAVSQKWPVLLYGPAGGGKTALISKLARESGHQVLSFHMDDQIDVKTLIGSYVCTEQPGEFRWQHGSLTQAVEKGYWVVFEDIDKAPMDVQSILLPLLEGARSFVTGHGEAITVAEGFRLFSTISTFKLDGSRGTEGSNSPGVLWRRVMVGHSSEKDLQEIVKTWYPNLESLAWKLIETFESVNAVILQQLAGSICKFSLRDLLKWCKRIAGLDFHLMGDYLSAYECNCIYHEAVDVFAAFSTSVDNRLIIMRDIARIWAVPASLTETLYPLNKPIIQDSHTDLRVGRVTLQRTQTAFRNQKKLFVEIRNSLHVLERIACSVKFNEPILLVGETGTGKTTLVQNLALRLGQKLTVLNLSQQSDIADLLGGFKPMDTQFICVPLYKEFEVLFSKTFSIKENKEIFVRLEKYRSNRNWNSLLRGMQNCVDRYRNLVNAKELGSGRKRKKPLNEEVQKAWEKFMLKLETAHGQICASSGMLFSFVEGAFVSALRNGDWILLDEVNLAPLEILQRVIGVLEGENGSFCLAERGDADYINRHPNFRIFACMNPATDAGKRDLPYSLRSRFTEYFVDDVLDEEDLALFINQFMDDSHLDRELVYKIVRFYKDAKKGSEERLQDGANQKPQYSLRSLYRALEYTQKAKRKFGFQKAFYDGFCMFFLTLLDGPSAKLMKEMILSYLLGGKVPPHVPFDGYLMIRGDSNFDDFLESYVLTRSVKDHLTNLARAVLIKRYPVLLQGPTSSGKTSLVKYLAAITGHEFVRINNHEHTDLQEYLGTYITDACGKLVFHEGVLVKAVRNGHWIVLDELNLAPSDVLEALNRLLDDNRELFVPELRETVCAHPDFMLFATQNPPTFYGGRKMLSRAFRNRFVEVHVDEIPDDELSTILERRCKIPGSHAKEMVEVMKELQLHRQGSKVFAGKHGFITPRDLFRWADRYRNFGISHQDLAREGYYLLAERLRNESEKAIVKSVLEKHHRAKLDEDDMYKQESGGGNTSLYLNKCLGVPESLGNITWTKTMERLYFLLERCYKLREPVLLVGETGSGKTTVCQLLSIVMGSNLHILNCHQYTETSDFLGGFYPVRERSTLTSDYKHLVERLMQLKAIVHFPTDMVRAISADIRQASLTLGQLDGIINGYRQGRISFPNITVQDVETLDQMKLELAQLHQKWQTIFMWQDGPLIRAMKNGDLFLVDEISLADDSVLERLNSVLEPERKLSLAEKGGSVMETITAHSKFFLLATMNPGGDYGKKELSPALRNRFTEIWVSPVSDLKELRSIALQRFSDPKLTIVVDPMLKFWEWFDELQTGRMLTVRDLLSWVAFINVTARSLQPDHALLHGAFLVLLDGLSLGTGISKSSAGEMRRRCLSFLLEQLKVHNASIADINLSRMENYGWGDLENSAGISCSNDMQCDTLFGIKPFYIDKGDEKCEVEGFEFSAPTTRRNALRVLRAMQLMKPVLLEGSPGVGKTSLIVALGKFSGHRVVRINLSEQTDIMDLLGSDLPVESDEGMKFAWSDGILLQALKSGCWVLLDELNLAPQSVLEGLNAILDHRAEVFIPELGRTFKCPSSFRVFACQNPSYQGGGRKGLPKSFLNRFTKVYVDELVEDDYLFICSSLYPLIPKPLLTNLIFFNKRLHEDTMLYHKFAQDGSPWEFNLRDVIRSCQIIEGAPEKFKFSCFLDIVYVQRMRTAADRREVIRLYEQVFGLKPFINPYPRVQLNSRYLIAGNTAIQRNNFQSPKILNTQLKILPGIRRSLEAAAQCVKHEWLCILIGPPSSGKTSLIRILAQLTGNVINELNLSSATDISELLGCFEQYNDKREFRFVVAQLECYVNEYCSLLVASSGEAFDGKKKDLVTRWLAFLSSEDCKVMSNSSLTLLIEIVNQLRLDMEKSLPVSWSFKDLSRTLKTILKLQQNCLRRPFSAKFEWLTGLLIKAIESGEWVVLENANLCSPTVLDRINSLVEPCGSITVNECGIVDGKPVVVQPHPNFRMFLTVNPSYGEVSRAMRNRGVEIFMMQPYWLLNGGIGNSCEEVELKDLKRFIVLSGIPIGRLVDIMAKAYNYAKSESLRLNKHITYLELARWVQLFQQLISNGNQPMWSLQISWEHTFISPLGEPEGGEIIAHVKDSYLSLAEFSEFDSSFFGCSLCLPGGWPMPLMLSDFVLYSKEASVKQNCLYLEYMGAQCASYESCSARDPSARCQMRTYLVDLPMLYQICFPTVSNGMRQTEFDLALANKMLLFASNWIIEQATERDISLYFLWFSWFNSRIQPFCQFFGSFLALLQQEMKHPIWNCIIRCRQKLLFDYPVDLDMQPIPMLSFELADLTASNDMSKSSSRLLRNAISCVGPLRLSFQQWNAESDYSGEFAPLLKSLRVLEEEVLNILLQCPSFDVLIQLYTDLLEHHIVFWNYVNLSQFEYLGLCWHDLMKAAVKLRDFCPKAVKVFLMESRNLDKVSSWHFNSQKSLLWSYGGHPYLPPSRELYDKHHQLLVLCELIWPRKTKSWNMENNQFVEVVVSSNPELRFLAMQGVCMSSHVTSKCDEDNVNLEQQLEKTYQFILGRFECEKHKLETNVTSNEPPFPLKKSAASCVFFPEALYSKSGFDSWKDTLPVIDSQSFFLDMDLLQELSMVILVDGKGMQHGLSRVSNLLETALKFSLDFSSRSPMIFLPHQKILWTVGAWSSVDAVSTKISSFVLEMWFGWHSSLWAHQFVLVKNFLKVDSHDIPLPDMLFQPVRTATIFQILQCSVAIRDYHLHCLKLRVVSCNFWQSSPPGTNVPDFLLSAARSLFQQIIFAHKKSFKTDKYAEIKSLFSSFQKIMVKREDIRAVSSLIASSSHQRLTSKSSMDFFIKPILEELYLQCPSTDFLYNLGCAWLRIGGLRFHLLLVCDDLDPALKYSCKDSQLVNKMCLLKLEMKVRQECDHLAGSFLTREADEQRAHALENVEVERKRLQRKIVFRSDPGEFKKLKYECDEFLNVVTSVMVLIKNVESMDLQQLSDQVRNWQETATSFIDRLSNEYAEYIDIIQPVQVAVYEMKLGLSLVLSGELQKKMLKKVEHDTMDGVLDAIYSFMRFPRGCAFKSILVKVNSHQPEIPSIDIEFPTDIWPVNLSLLEKLLTVTRDLNDDNKVSILKLKVALHQTILARITHSVAYTLLLDNTSFGLLDKIFDEFTGLWMNMKVQAKSKEDYEAQQYKFRSRAFKLESIFEYDISNPSLMFPNESFPEWEEFVSEEHTERMEATEEHEALVDEWNYIEEHILKNLVLCHNQLFGSCDLAQTPGNAQVSDSDRLLSFIESYTLGADMIKGLEGFLSSSLDAKLLPEHLLRLSLEHEQKFVLSDKSTRIYNFYKDSNASAMVKMVELLTTLKQHILSLLKELEDHLDLQKVLDVIEMLLAIPLSSPLAKALLGLQFLLHKAWILQENVPKHSISNQLEPVLILVSSWQKLEFESWPALLDEVQDQYDINAGKLWFPLYSVLHHRDSLDIDGYSLSTIQSLKEFIQTSSIGEFKKRLQLLLAFYGQINAGLCVGSYLSLSQRENLKILYNLFGYYLQFLPTVLKHIESSRKNIEMELKELLKLCRWERPESYMSLENFKKPRQKLKKLIQKYTDVLQQSLMLILDQERIKAESIEGPKLNDFFDKNGEMLGATFDMIQSSDMNRSTWCAKWREGVDFALQNLHLGRTPKSDFSFSCFKDAEVARSVCQSSPSRSVCPVYQEEWKEVWCTLEKICLTARDCDSIWNETSKSPGKKRAWSELLKLLESCGLSKHKPTEDSASSQWVLEPSYDVQHLLLTQSELSYGGGDVDPPSQLVCFPHESLDMEWRKANQYYFKSMATKQLLCQIHLKRHKDLTLDEVNISRSFIEHLIVIQQEQRGTAYDFAEKLSRLRLCVSSLKKIFSSSTAFDSECIIPNQHATFICMWRQKQLFDCMCAMLHEESLLLKTVESAHSCSSVKDEAHSIVEVINNFVPIFQKSKESLDMFLLGNDKVISTLTATMHPCVVSKQMEQLVPKNFEVIREFEEHLCGFHVQDVDKRSVKEALLSSFEDIFKKAKLVEKEFCSDLDKSDELTAPHETYSELGVRFDGALKKTLEIMKDAFQTLGSLCKGHPLSEETLRSIPSWKFLFESYAANLRLDRLCDALLKMIFCAVKLVDHSDNRSPSQSLPVGAHMKHVHELAVLVLNFGDRLLHDFLAMHKTVSVMTHVLANLFASLYVKGFGTKAENEGDDRKPDLTSDANGTGMGAGEGMKDVSEQLTDEDQLLGLKEKNEEQALPDEVPNKNDKGIEMNEDFVAEIGSVSEDSGDESEEERVDEPLDSAMGQTGAGSEVVDEKLWDKEEDENPTNKKEKYETGPSVKDQDPGSRELRAREDSETAADDFGEVHPDDADSPDDGENGGENSVGDTENMEDVSMDKEAAFADPSGLKLDEPNQPSEEIINMDDQEGEDPMEEACSDEDDMKETDNTDGGAEEEKMNLTDEMDEEVSEQVDGTSERDNTGIDHEENTEMDLDAPIKDVFESGNPDSINDHLSNPASAAQPKGDSQAAESRYAAPDVSWSNSSDVRDELAPVRGLPSNSTTNEMEISLQDSSQDGKPTDDQPNTQLPKHDSSSVPKSQSNPYRNVGDALEEWKERVKVSLDLQKGENEVVDDMEDENADEYGFTSQDEKGTAQALGPASSDQIDKNINGSKPDGDGPTAHEEKDVSEMEIEKQDSEMQTMKTGASILKSKIKDEVPISDLDKSPNEESPQADGHGGSESLSESLVSMKRIYASEDIHQLSELSLSENERRKAQNVDNMTDDTRDDAVTLWRRYELRTTILSQELAEQLRLVMEPTLASKLQGDYKTGKRINMRKVIAYIASDFQKDNIWLRRLRPNKRDYQVVIAMDDSRSMSESGCGDVAIEALVTVCRAMSQLEVGSLAVTSFGKEGNIKLLHDFEKPFCQEAGVEMISGLTFQQENTIGDEPVIDLLKYLNNMLDTAAVNARLPSGQNPLQQLVLIISDGRINEKDMLKRHVRELLSKKRLVAFLLLDSSQESIMDLQEAVFDGRNVKLTKYLDSFPFPYYIILKEIEALPRTLADLLRQWFELMQNMRD